MKYNYEGKELNIYDNWDQVSFKNFIRITKLVESNQKKQYGEELLAILLLEALSNVEEGFLLDITWGQLTDLIPYVNNLMDKYSNIDVENIVIPKSWIIDGIEYSYHISPNDYKAGEVADIKTYIQQQENRVDYLADIAAVMIRPATKVITDAGVEMFKLTKNNPEDHSINKKRILELPFNQVNKVMSFFLFGLMTSTTNMENSIPQNQVE